MRNNIGDFFLVAWKNVFNSCCVYVHLDRTVCHFQMIKDFNWLPNYKQADFSIESPVQSVNDRYMYM